MTQISLSDCWEFQFNIPPYAQKRPRFIVDRESVVRGGKIVSPRAQHAYDDPAAQSWKEVVGIYAQRQMKQNSRQIIVKNTPLKVVISFYLWPPKSWPKEKAKMAFDGDILPTSRPDLDNFIKSTLDALTDIVWEDDAQIVDLGAMKRYAQVPSVNVLVYAVT